VARVSDPDEFSRSERQIRATGFCRRPVRLAGKTVQVDSETDEVLHRFSTADEPDGVVLTACDNRRESLCPSCSETYRRDAWHLVAAGLRGGKGVRESFIEHPALFVTLTAPSFGAVHASRRSEAGDPLPCRPRRDPALCPHGRPTACWDRHSGSDEVVGQPLCRDCFHYEAVVIWNATVPELWRRTMIYLQRELARAADMTLTDLRRTIRVSYVKVAEYQARGAVHLHAVLRLDGADGERPPSGFNEGMLTDAIETAVPEVTVRVDAGDRRWFARWGDQLDIRPIGESAELSREAVAAYIAKCATKSSDQFGRLDRLRGDSDLELLDANEHIVEICRTAWRLGGLRDLSDLKFRRWAHTLGYRGHWSTKSRYYSTTLGALRDERRQFAKHRNGEPERDEVVSLGDWRYDGIGHQTAADAWLAESAGSRRRTERRIGREELTTKVGTA
jgi:hypothetical protein